MSRVKFSIIIPTFNRPFGLKTCLEAFTRLEHPAGGFEVVVVDDGGKADLDAVVEPFKSNLNVTLLRQRNGGPGSARNFGASRAQGAFLVFTDDDCTPDPGWLKALERNLDANPGAMVGGLTVNGLRHNAYSAASQLLIDYLYDYFVKTGSPHRFFTMNNAAVPAAGFDGISGFDPVFGRAAAEDRDFCARWLGSGRKMVYAPEAVLFHDNRSTFSGFCKQHLNYGAGRATMRRKHAAAAAFEPLSFYLGLVAYPFTSGRKNSGRLVATALFFLSQIMNAAGYLAQQLKKPKKKES